MAYGAGSQNVTIAASGTLSTALDMGTEAALVRIGMPTQWTAAAITLSVSPDDVTYRNLYDRNGNEYTIQAAASRSIILPPADTVGARFVKVRSGTSGATVAQTAAVTLQLVARPV